MYPTYMYEHMYIYIPINFGRYACSNWHIHPVASHSLRLRAGPVSTCSSITWVAPKMPWWMFPISRGALTPKNWKYIYIYIWERCLPRSSVTNTSGWHVWWWQAATRYCHMVLPRYWPNIHATASRWHVPSKPQPATPSPSTLLPRSNPSPATRPISVEKHVQKPVLLPHYCHTCCHI